MQQHREQKSLPSSCRCDLTLRMTISNFRATEPLYIVIVREKNAEQSLRDWARGANVQVTIETNRMKIFETRTLNHFQMHWNGDWTQVLIWDCWNKRHIQNA